MWYSKYDVLRDLSVAQGHSVPTYIQTSSRRNEAPVSPDRDVYAPGDNIFINAPPDLPLIRQMLDACREDEGPQDVVEEVLQNSNLNPWSDEFVPQNEASEKSVPTALSEKSLKMKKKLARNVALTSILNLNNSKGKNEDSRQVPGNNTNEKKKSFYMNSRDMFRKKIKSPECTLSSQNTANKAPQSQNSSYQASPLAAEYYLKYLERVEKRKREEETKEDIWRKAMREMEEIDRKSRAASKAELEANQSATETGCDPMDKVRLSQHRHLMSEDCVVCQVLCKNYKKTKNVVNVIDECHNEIDQCDNGEVQLD